MTVDDFAAETYRQERRAARCWWPVIAAAGVFLVRLAADVVAWARWPR